MDHEEKPQQVEYPADPARYFLLEEIGRGVNSVVTKALCKEMDSLKTAFVALKCVDLNRWWIDLPGVPREAQTMSCLSHPNVLGSYCSFTVGHELWVVMPFMCQGSLRSIMSLSFSDGLSEPCIDVILRQTLSGLAYLHMQGYHHRDIKLSNILIDSNGTVKLADFGVSASVYEVTADSAAAILIDKGWKPYWMAPELIHSHVGYSFKADIWSFGITALELAHGRPPLSHLPLSKSQMMKITKRFRFWDNYEKKRNSKRKKFSNLFKDMVGLCLNQDPSKRPSAHQLLKHPFFRECHGPELLVKNILKGLPSIDQRSTLEARLQSTKEEAGNEDREFPARRISGWNFNKDHLELDPVFEKVRFGGETIIPDNRASSNSSSPGKAAEGEQREAETSRQDGDIDELVERLKTELENEEVRKIDLEIQLEVLSSMISDACSLTPDTF
ncbi:Non-specific serine/threonine protein kinase [Bertholletia excelsa]